MLYVNIYSKNSIFPDETFFQNFVQVFLYSCRRLGQLGPQDFGFGEKMKICKIVNDDIYFRFICYIFYEPSLGRALYLSPRMEVSSPDSPW